MQQQSPKQIQFYEKKKRPPTAYSRRSRTPSEMAHTLLDKSYGAHSCSKSSSKYRSYFNKSNRKIFEKPTCSGNGTKLGMPKIHTNEVLCNCAIRHNLKNLSEFEVAQQLSNLLTPCHCTRHCNVVDDKSDNSKLNETPSPQKRNKSRPYSAASRLFTSPSPMKSSEKRVPEIPKTQAKNGIKPFKLDPTPVQIVEIQKNQIRKLGTQVFIENASFHPEEKDIELGSDKNSAYCETNKKFQKTGFLSSDTKNQSFQRTAAQTAPLSRHVSPERTRSKSNKKSVSKISAQKNKYLSSRALSSNGSDFSPLKPTSQLKSMKSLRNETVKANKNFKKSSKMFSSVFGNV